MTTMKPTAHAIYPARFTPSRGTLHCLAGRRYSAPMAPMIGPKLAPTIVKNPIRLAATPVIASRTPTAAAAIVLDTRGTPGIIVLKLLPAMNAQKHEAGIEAMANRNSIAEAI